jgi:hypothetical protein
MPRDVPELPASAVPASVNLKDNLQNCFLPQTLSRTLYLVLGLAVLASLKPHRPFERSASSARAQTHFDHSGRHQEA